MSDNTLRIATRKSALALWQANYVRKLLCQSHPDLQVEITGIDTMGDKILDRPLADDGGKGLFLKELEEALLNNQADIAVHSMKDVVVDLPEGLDVPVVLKRDDPRDVFISNKYKSLQELHDGARIGTSSLRRQCQLKAWRSELEILNLRGNVDTRIRKLAEGEYDAIILAAAGIKRLGLENHITEYLEIDFLLPAIGQGAIGIEMRKEDDETFSFIECLNDSMTSDCIKAERSFGKKLFGGCHLPIAAYARIINKSLVLQGLVGQVDGNELIQDIVRGDIQDAESIGIDLGNKLLDKGAAKILDGLVNDH